LVFAGSKAKYGPSAPQTVQVQARTKEAAINKLKKDFGLSKLDPRSVWEAGLHPDFEGAREPFAGRIAEGDTGKPTAHFVHYQETGIPGKPSVAMYNVVGGLYDGSTMTAKSLTERGIEVPETPAEGEETQTPTPETRLAVRPKESIDEYVARINREAQAQVDLEANTIETVKEVYNSINKGKGIGTWVIKRPDFKILSRIFSTPLHYYQKIPTAWRMFGSANKLTDNRSEMVDRITLNPKTGEHYTKIIHDASKNNPEYETILAPYLVENDVNAIGYRVHLNPETGKYDIFAPKETIIGEFDTNEAAQAAANKMIGTNKVPEFVNDEAVFKYSKNDNGKWNLIIPSGKPVASFNTDALAVEEMLRRELADFNEKYNPSPDTLKALESFRRTAYNVFNVFTQNMRDIITWYESRNLPLPETVVRIDGEEVGVNLKVALATMGDRRGYYFPRIRNSGQYMLIAKKPTGERFTQFYDLAIENPPDAGGNIKRWKAEINWRAPIGREVKRLIGEEGYPSKNIYEGEGENRRLVSGIEIRRSPKTSEDVFEMAGSVIGMQEEINKALNNMKSEKDIGNIDTEIMDLFAQSLAEQVSDIEKGRGHRGHMIRRDIARGKNVWKGYEEDPAKAIASLVASVSGGEAKKIMALEFIRQFTGTDISWQEFKDIKLYEYGYDAYFEENPKSPVTREEFEVGIPRTKGRPPLKLNDPEAFKVNEDKIELLKDEIKTATDAEKDKLKEELKDARNWLYREYRALVNERRIDSSEQKNAFHDLKIFMKDILRNDEAVDRIMNT
ncbi:MAG: hypothetical protein KKD77_23390, partial [Gammaproteobacteria bacterium]|nr:hypothetical protein [Gammaproteobacteria bacterium]